MPESTPHASLNAVEAARTRAQSMLADAGIVLTPAEAARLEVADFGLGHLEVEGLQLITYINTERVCAKDLVLFPRQTCPEHRHPPIDGEPGKEETFRCRAGEVYVYLPGPPTPPPLAAHLPGGDVSTAADSEGRYTVFAEYILLPGDQVTIPPDTRHWFQAGDDGAVVSEFSTRSRDEFDVFTDARIVR